MLSVSRSLTEASRCEQFLSSLFMRKLQSDQTDALYKSQVSLRSGGTAATDREYQTVTLKTQYL